MDVSKSYSKQTLEQILSNHVNSNAKTDRVEIKGLASTSMMKVNFNVSMKEFLSDNFQFLMKQVGSHIIEHLINLTIILIKRDKFYIQLNRNSLSSYFEVKNKP